MDDYPRSPIPSDNEYHVDLFSWIAKATAIMARLERVLTHSYYSSSYLINCDKRVNININDINNDNENGKIIQSQNKRNDSKKSKDEKKSLIQHEFSGKFSTLSEYLSNRLDSLHWSEVHKGDNIPFLFILFFILLLMDFFTSFLYLFTYLFIYLFVYFHFYFYFYL